MSASRLALPTPERLREEPVESGGWSRFFDAALAALDALDDEEARRPAPTHRDRGNERGTRT